MLTETTVAVPAAFAREFLLDIGNRAKLARLPDGREPEVWWEGPPWTPGSRLAIKSPTTTGKPATVRSDVLAPGPSELCRVVVRKAGLRITSAFSVEPIDKETCKIVQSGMIEGWASVLAKLVPVERMQESALQSEIEFAWLQAKQATAGSPE